eukprot:TRINITY_DN11156_c0_g1_i1.p1 TRINITY_DN11156_c0_g1~~TRINITY_DN11156_c0_g1_i1.p1  ORF type:complete len:100 (+),score=25.94 TRINITY_DN11156_c0_g1_i1:36-302(+)
MEGNTEVIVECFADGDDFGDVLNLTEFETFAALSEAMVSKFPTMRDNTDFLYFVNHENKKVKITPGNFSYPLLNSGIVKEIRIKPKHM